MSRFILIAITLLLLVIVIRWLGFGIIFRKLASIGWEGVGLISVLYGISQTIRTLRFRIALKSAKGITFGEMFGIVSIHQFLSHVFPARIGEMSFPLMIKKLKGTPIVQTSSVLILIRLQEMIILGAFLMTALLLQEGIENKIGLDKVAQDVVVGAFSFFVLSLAAFFLIPSFIKLSTIIVRYSAIIGAKISRIGLFLNKGAEVLDDLQVAFRQNRLATLNLQCLSLTILMWLNMFIIFHMIMLMSGVEISFSQSVIASSIATFIQLLPVNPLGSFGSLEAGWTIGFVMMGVDAKTALTTGLILHFIVIAILAMTACFAWLILFRVER